jgi:hypothetical protein
MTVNGKKTHVETISGMGKGGKKKNFGGVNSNMIHVIYCKNLCKCHNMTYPVNNKINK